MFYIEVFLISEFMFNPHIFHEFRNKEHFNIQVFARLSFRKSTNIWRTPSLILGIYGPPEA